MKKLALCLVVLALPLMAYAQQRALAVDPNDVINLTDCASGGATTVNLTAGRSYVATVTDADVWLCQASTCAAGGWRLPLGVVFAFNVPGVVAGANVAYACRSASSTGDINFAALR